MSNAANDNGLVRIVSIAIFAVGRSGRRVSLDRGGRSGRKFGVDLTWSNGVVTPAPETFPAYYAAVGYGTRVLKAAETGGMLS
jgi:hypothetical protein